MTSRSDRSPVLVLVALATVVGLSLVGPLLTWATAELATHVTWTAPADPAGTSLLDALGTATVRYGEMRCPANGKNTVRCRTEPWLWVGPLVGRARGAESGLTEARRCLWLHPAEGAPNASVAVQFPDIPAGARLGGHAALLDTARAGEAVDVSFRHLETKHVLAHVRLNDSGGRAEDRRWTPWSATLGPAGTFEIEVGSRSANWRHVCVTAFVDAAP